MAKRFTPAEQIAQLPDDHFDALMASVHDWERTAAAGNDSVLRDLAVQLLPGVQVGLAMLDISNIAYREQVARLEQRLLVMTSAFGQTIQWIENGGHHTADSPFVDSYAHLWTAPERAAAVAAEQHTYGMPF